MQHLHQHFEKIGRSKRCFSLRAAEYFPVAFNPVPLKFRFSAHAAPRSLLFLLRFTPVAVGLLLSAPGCRNQETSGRNLNLPAAEPAKIHCGACHLPPDPALLPKEVWERSVLPRMGYYLGFRDSLVNPYQSISPADRMLVEQAQLFPENPLLEPADWTGIRAYYLSLAPDSLPALAPSTPAPIRQFDVHSISLEQAGNPYTAMIRFDSLTGQWMLSDIDGRFMQVTAAGKVGQLQQTISPVVDWQRRGNAAYLLEIGTFHPSDQALGTFSKASDKKNIPIIKGLKRPVTFDLADFDQDGSLDVVVGNFGYYFGDLSWYKLVNDQAVARQTLLALPGTTKVIATDVNQDALPDIIALIGQGAEQVSAWINDGKGRFRQETWLRFPPVYGSSDLAWTDINGDGHRDLVIANGDNADFSIVPKPYHGLRIYLNDGSNHFSEAYFYPMYGCTQVQAADFDQDGDIDLAATAFFPAYNIRPEASFVYLENQSAGARIDFTPSGLPDGQMGRWLVLNQGDPDRDGDIDLLLGGFHIGPGRTPPALVKKWQEQGPHVVWLENKRR